jgi:hypothetical protein
MSNIWLAGFSEGDSNFYIRVTFRKLNPTIGKRSKAQTAYKYSIE